MFMVTGREIIFICSAVLNQLMLTAEWEKIRKCCQLKQKAKGPEKKHVNNIYVKIETIL